MANYFLKRSPQYLSFAQSGEDRLALFILKHQFGLTDLNFLDIGANHPTELSNTYLFYVEGFHGVLLEPDPDLVKALKKARPKDTVINKAVTVDAADNLDFYLMQPHTLNTFSEKEVKLYQEHYKDVKVRGKIKVQTTQLDVLMKEYFSTGLDFLSIDIEGLDYDILSNFNFKKYRPKVVCVETMVYLQDKELKKSDDVIQLMLKNDYFIYADTYVNTIFVDKKAWKKQGLPKLHNVVGW